MWLSRLRHSKTAKATFPAIYDLVNRRAPLLHTVHMQGASSSSTSVIYYFVYIFILKFPPVERNGNADMENPPAHT